jgi:endo-alpha-N-acetylgalactosaminidase
MRFAPEGATSSPELALSKQTVTAGATVRIDVTGLAPGELVDVELHSDPVLLGEFRADGSGEVHASLGIPAATPAGTHSIVVHAAVSGTATAELQVLAAPGGPAAGPGGLASTGVQLGLLGWAALALLAGILLTASRILRRQRPIPKEFA